MTALNEVPMNSGISSGVVQEPNTGKCILLTLIYVSLSPMRNEPPERRNHVFLTFEATIVPNTAHLFSQQIFIQGLYAVERV